MTLFREAFCWKTQQHSFFFFFSFFTFPSLAFWVSADCSPSVTEDQQRLYCAFFLCMSISTVVPLPPRGGGLAKGQSSAPTTPIQTHLGNMNRSLNSVPVAAHSPWEPLQETERTCPPSVSHVSTTFSEVLLTSEPLSRVAVWLVCLGWTQLNFNIFIYCYICLIPVILCISTFWFICSSDCKN